MPKLRRLNGERLANLLKTNPRLEELNINEQLSDVAFLLLTEVPRLRHWRSIRIPVSSRLRETCQMWLYMTEALHAFPQPARNSNFFIGLDYATGDLPEILQTAVHLVRTSSRTLVYIIQHRRALTLFRANPFEICIIKFILLRWLTLIARLSLYTNPKTPNLRSAFGIIFKSCQGLKVICWTKETGLSYNGLVAIKTGWSDDTQSGE